MEWTDKIGWLFGLVGGSTGLISLYMARPKKQGLKLDNETKEIQNDKSIIETAISTMKMSESLREALQDDYDKFKKEMEKDIKELKDYNNEKKSAIKKAYQCDFPLGGNICPVVYHLEHKCLHINNKEQ